MVAAEPLDAAEEVRSQNRVAFVFRKAALIDRHRHLRVAENLAVLDDVQVNERPVLPARPDVDMMRCHAKIAIVQMSVAIPPFVRTL